MRFLAFALTVQHSTLLLSQTISIILYGRAFRLFPVFQNNNYHNKNNANRLGPLDTLKDNREASSKVHILWTNIEHMRELDKPVTILMI
jgi:pullulanase/glycogen debranching enzyme